MRNSKTLKQGAPSHVRIICSTKHGTFGALSNDGLSITWQHLREKLCFGAKLLEQKNQNIHRNIQQVTTGRMSWPTIRCETKPQE